MNNDNASESQPQEISIIAKGAGVIFVGSIVGTGLRYLFEIIVARNIGAELFGIFFIGLAILKISEIVSTFGLHRGVLRYTAIFWSEKDRERTKGAIIFSLRATGISGIILGILIILLSKYLALNIFHKIDLITVLRLFAIAVPLTALTSISVFATQGFKIMKYRVYVREICEPLIRIVVVIFVFLIGWKLYGAIGAFIISLFTGSVLAFYYLRRVFPELTEKRTNTIFETHRLLSYSWPLLLAEFFSLIIIWINILMIGYFRTSQEVGIYSASHRTALFGQMILISFNAIFSPIIADLYNKKDMKKLEELFKVVTKWILMLSLPVCLLLVFYASEILNLFGKNFMQGALCLMILAAAQLVNSIFGTSGFMIMMSGRSKINLLNNVVVVILNIGLNIILIPSYGIVGAALALSISILVINLIMLLEVYLILKIHPFRKSMYKSVLAAIISTLFLVLLSQYIVKTLHPFIQAIVGSLLFLVLYILLMLLLKMEHEDRIIYQKLKDKIRHIKNDLFNPA